MKGNQWPVQRSNQISKARTKLGRSEIEAVEEDSREDGLRVETLFLHRYTGRLILRASRNISRVDSTPPDKESRDCLRCGKSIRQEKITKRAHSAWEEKLVGSAHIPDTRSQAARERWGSGGGPKSGRFHTKLVVSIWRERTLTLLSAFSFLLCGIYTSK